MNATTTHAHSLPDGTYVVTGSTGVLAVPGRPRPEHAGAPAVQIVPLGDTAIVQAGVCWPIPEQTLRRDVAGAATLPLRSAVTALPQAQLVLHGAHGPQVLATSDTSGYPPYTAVFSLTVDTATATTLQRAVAGEPNLVSVTYQAVARGLPLMPTVIQQSAARGVVIAKDRQVTATADVASWARQDNEQE